MASKNIKGIIVEIGGNTEPLGKALKKADEQAKKTQSELKEINKALKNAPESAVLWAQKQELLTQAVKDSKEKLKALKDAQEEIDRKYKNNEIGAEAYRNFQREVEWAELDVKKFEDQLADLERTADNTSDEVEDLGKSAEDAGEKAEDSGDGFTILKGAVSDLAADGIRAAIDGFKELATEGDSALNSLQTKTGATAEQMADYQDVINNLYANNYGEDKNDIANSIAEIKQQLGDITPDNLENVTEKALLLRDTFNFDVNESIRAAKMLMQQFEISADEAYTLIAQGAQNGLNKNGDLLDTINEYGVHYKQLGYNAEEFFNSLENGSDAGTFSVDKLGDAMKEFGIRAKDTAASTTEGFELIGLDADIMREKFAAGGESAREATQQVLNELFSMDDQVKQNQAGVDLFGTMWEDLGIEGVKALMNVTGEADRTSSTLQDIADVKYNDIGSQIEQLGRTVKTDLLVPLSKELLPIAKKGTNWLVKNIPKITKEGKNLVSEIDKVGTAIKSVGTVINKVGTGDVAGATKALFELWGATRDTTDEMQELIDAEQKYQDTIKKGIDETNKLKDSTREAAEQENEHWDSVNSLWQELQKLADSSGKVKEADQIRAQYIIGELSEATGQEISMINGQIQKYDELKQSIEKVIATKRAEALLSKFDSEQADLLISKSETENEYASVSAKAAQEQSKINAFESFYKNKGLSFDYNGYTDYNKMYDDLRAAARDSDKFSKDDLEFFNQYAAEYTASKTMLDQYNSELDLLQEKYNTAVDDIQRYEDAERAYAEGRIEDVQDILLEEKDTNRRILKDSEKTNSERERAFKESIKSQSSTLEMAVKSGKEVAVKSALDGFTQITEDGKKYGAATARGYGDEFRTACSAALAKGYDLTDMYNYFKKQGLDVGEIFGEEVLKGIKNQIQNQNAYERGMKVVTLNPVNSPGDVKYVEEKKKNGTKMFATGGFLARGEAVVAEAGPELLEIMNGGVKVTPLTSTARNTSVGASGQKNYYNYYTINVEKISNDTDISKLSHKLAAEQRRIEAGKGG